MYFSCFTVSFLFLTSILLFVFAAVKDEFFLSDCKNLEEKGRQCVPSDHKCLQELYLGGKYG